MLTLEATGGSYKLVSTLGLMLGNGDGTFSPMTEIASTLGTLLPIFLRNRPGH